MATQEIMRNVPADQLAGLVARFESLAAAVQTFPQGDGLFTVVATFQGSPHSTPFATTDDAETVAPVNENAEALPALQKSTDFAVLAGEYRAWFDACECSAARRTEVEARVDHLLANAPRYKALGQTLQIPWAFLGIVHSLESNFNFMGHLHNGDPLTQRTTRVPAGRPRAGNPPFTWEESATDAMQMKGYVGLADWSPARMLFRWEAYNGFGYRRMGLPSPYLWSFSPLYTKGLFVADHEFDPDKVSRQCGAAVLLKVLQERAA